jgi:spore maturation protein CgeB
MSSVLIIGVDQPGNLEGSYCRAFEQLGWSVNRWNPVEVLYSSVRGGRLGKLFSTYVNVEPWSRKANLRLIEFAGILRPDLILVIATEGLRPGTLAQLKVLLPRSLVYCLFPDTPHNLIPERILCLPLFDRVITVSPGWVDSFARLGSKRACYLPPAADTELHYPVNGKGVGFVGSHDVAFVGIWRHEREELLEQLLDFDLGIWGSDYWKSKPRSGSKLPSRWHGRGLVGAEFAQACSQNRILLNIIDGVGWPGPNMRTFEQPACRAFSLVTRTPAILDLFREGENVECFASVEEAREKIRFYLGNEAARQRVAQRAYDAVVKGGHTYVDRAKQLIAWMAQDS